MKKKLLVLLLAFAMVFSFAACGGSGSGGDEGSDASTDLSSASWDEIVEQAKGTDVAFYGWGGDENRNNWLNGTVADYLKENYDINFEYVGMDINDILAKLTSEKEAGEETGSIDMIWINGENFYTAKENGLLYGPFTEQLPNMEAYVDLNDPETLNDFCKPIDGYEAPYAKAQMVMFNDSAVTPETPKNADEFLEYCKENKGKVTYPALPDFTGSAFVRNIIYEKCGWEQFQNMEADKAAVQEAIEPALEYLRELNPYLWNEGKTFPADSTALDKMFQDGEVVMDMSYGPFTVAWDLGVAFQTHPGRQAFISSGSKEALSALESRRVSIGRCRQCYSRAVGVACNRSVNRATVKMHGNRIYSHFPLSIVGFCSH